MAVRVFLGGTSGRNRWREGLIRRLVARGVPREALFDPVVKEWNAAARKREERVKREAEILFFYLGDPMERGTPVSAFALVEATLAVCREPARAILVFDLESVTGHARKVYSEAAGLLRQQSSRASILESLDEAEGVLAKR